MRDKTARAILKKVKDDYAEIADEFSMTRQYSWPDFKFFKPHLKSGLRILDLGCGNGRLYEFLLPFKVNYLGVDPVIELIQEGQQKFPTAKFKKGDFLQIPAGKHQFDIVFSIAAFHHLPSKKMRLKAMEEVKRVLKPGGYFIVSVWNLRQLKYRKCWWESFWRWLVTFGDYQFNDLFIPWGKEKKVKRYYHSFSPHELKQLWRKSGFLIEEELFTRKEKKVKLKKSFNLIYVLKNG